MSVSSRRLAICILCGRRQHLVCSLHMDEIWLKGFHCKNCHVVRDEPRNIFTAMSKCPSYF